jgi:putative inorganic carbon (HCO3(-)) transporter
VLVLLLFYRMDDDHADVRARTGTTWTRMERVMKTMLMILVTMMIVRTAADVKMLVVTVALSLGFWGFKSGLYTSSRAEAAGMMGPANSYISDNNTLALGLVTRCPCWYIWCRRRPRNGSSVVQSPWRADRVGALGSYSRGALLGAIGMSGYSCG